MRKIIALLSLGFVLGVYSSDKIAAEMDHQGHGMHHQEKEDTKTAELTTRSPRKDELGKEAGCPVMGTKHKVKAKTEVIDYKDESYYFCCAGCPGEFKKDPEKYAKKMTAEKSEARIRKARKNEIGKDFVCPVMGGEVKVKKDTFAAEYKDKTYYFCCQDCIGKFSENPQAYINNKSEQHRMNPGDHGMMKNMEEPLSGSVVNGVREINIKAFQFGFDPDIIVVKKGEKIRLKAISMDVTHGIAIKEYKIKKKLPANKEKDIVFTADKAGEFHFHCSVYCGAGHKKMHGKLIVKKISKRRHK